MTSFHFEQGSFVVHFKASSSLLPFTGAREVLNDCPIECLRGAVVDRDPNPSTRILKNFLALFIPYAPRGMHDDVST